MGLVLFGGFEAPRPYVGVGGEDIVLAEGDGLFDDGAGIGRSPNWAKGARVPALAAGVVGGRSRRTTRDQGGRQGEEVVGHRDVLGPPPAVPVERGGARRRCAGVGGDRGAVRCDAAQLPIVGQVGHGRVAQRAVAAPPVARAAVAVGVFPLHHATPVVGQDVVGDGQRREPTAIDSTVTAAVGDVDGALGEVGARRALAPAVVDQGVVLDQGVVADLVEDAVAVIVGDVVAGDGDASVVGVTPQPTGRVVVDVVVGEGRIGRVEELPAPVAATGVVLAP